MLLTSTSAGELPALVPVDLFAAETGWEAKPEGLCRGEVCVPAPGALVAGEVDVAVAAERLGMPIVTDSEHGVSALGPAVGPAAGGRALSTAVAPDPQLATFDGNPFRLSALHGRKVLLVAWASW
jgi:hypothetical protein